LFELNAIAAMKRCSTREWHAQHPVDNRRSAEYQVLVTRKNCFKQL